MEDYKDVMLSEPPTRFNNPSTGPSIQAVSLENYKGILLCDRPANLRAAGNAAGLARNGGGDGDLPPFLPSGKAEDRHLGFQPTTEQRAKLDSIRSLRQSNPNGTKVNPALSKHRRWLKSFADEVKNMKLGEAERQIELQNKLQRIREQQGEERRRQKEQKSQPSDAADKGEPSSSNAAPLQQKSTKAVLESKKSKQKPKWAMTEDEALDAELEDGMDLIKFARGLNYDQFINDYEVKEALAIMRDRVKEIAAEKHINMDDVAQAAANEVDEDAMDDLDRLSEAPSTATTTTREVFESAAKQRREERRKAREAAEAAAAAASGGASHDQQWNSSTQLGEALRTAISSDALQLADKILAANQSMQKIHTRQSLARLLQNCVLSGKDATVALQRGTILDTGAPLTAPRTAKISAEATGLQDGEVPQRRILTDLRKAKDKAQNLPYMYRCPSL